MSLEDYKRNEKLNMLKLFKRWYEQYLASEEAVSLLIVLFLAFVIITLLGTSLSPVLAALVIAYILQGIINALKKYMSGKLAFGLVYLMFIIFLIGLALLLFPLVTRQLAGLVNEQLPNLFVRLNQFLISMPEKYPDVFTSEQVSMIAGSLNEEVSHAAQDLVTWSLNSFKDILGIFIFAVLVPILVFFFLKDKKPLMGWLGELMPRQRTFFGSVWRRIDDKLQNYVLGKLVEIVIVFVFTVMAFLIFDLNYAVLLALCVGLSVIIPYIGAVVVTVPVLIVAYLQFGWTADFATLAIVYFVIQILDGNVLVPVLFSEAVDLHPVAIIIAILVFGGLWGMWGVFFAIPLATLCNVLILTWPNAETSSTEDISL